MSNPLRKKLATSSAAWLLSWPVCASAATDQFGKMEPYFRMIWGLIVVLGVILLLYGLLRKRFSLLSQSPQRQIKIIEMKPLMGRKALCLVEVRGRQFLLGISNDRISPIASLSPEKTTFADTLKNSGADLGT